MSVECWEAGEQVGSFNPLVAGEGRAFLQRNETIVFMTCYLHTGSRNDLAPGLPLPPWQSLVAVPLQAARGSGSGSSVTGSDSQLVRSSQGIVLSAVDHLIPAKLVEKVKAGQFLEMCEFLPDIIKLVNRLDSSSLNWQDLYNQEAPFSRPQLWEVSSQLSLIQCFLLSMAIRTSDPLAREMMVYARVVLGDAQRHGGFGWIDYDRAARQQSAVDSTIPWNTLDPGLHSMFILGQQRASLSPWFCNFCQESDHSSSQWLWPFLSQPLSIRHEIGGLRD